MRCIPSLLRGMAGLPALVLMLHVFPAVAGEWEVEYVDTPRQFGYLTDRSLASDSQGNPHIVYGGSSLYHAWFDGECWHRETADSGLSRGHFASVGIDAFDRIHVSYYDQEHGDLRYACKTSGMWACETVDSGGVVGRHASIALDGNGLPHIAYCDDDTGLLRYAYRNDAGWHHETVDANGPVGHFVSLALDSSGNAFVACGVAGTEELRCAFRSDTGWVIERPDSLASVADHSGSLALDPAGRPHIAYPRMDGSSPGLGHAWRDSAGWHAETASQAATRYHSLMFDQGGVPHVAFFRPYELRHAYLDSAGWQEETVSGWPIGLYTGISIAFGSDSSPMISHVWSGDPVQLRLALRPGSTWQIWAIDTRGEVGSSSTIGIDSAGRAHVAYRDDAQELVKYAVRDYMGWKLEPVDTYAGGSMSLAVDCEGSPRIAYDRGECVRYAWLTDSGWAHEDVASMNSLYGSDQISLVLDGVGQPHLAYKAPAFGPHLFYARRQGGSWVIENLGPLGGGQSLAIDALGHAHIAYSPSGGGPVRYGYRDQEHWQIEELEAVGPGTASLALSSDGSPRLACWNGSTLLFAWKGSPEWHCETVCSEPAATWRSTLRVDPLDFPRIVWVSDAGLSHAWKDAQGWHVEVSGTDGYHPAMALDEYWLPAVSCGLGGNLAYVRQTSPSAMLARLDLASTELRLRWSPVPGAHEHWVFGALNRPYFSPGFEPGYEYRLAVLPADTLEWRTSSGACDPDSMGVYQVVAMDDAGQPLLSSSALGEAEYQFALPRNDVPSGPGDIRERPGLVVGR